jgi:hypothetical protein
MFLTQFKNQLKDKGVLVYNKFRLSSLMSYIGPNYFDLCGKDNKEIRETRNKLDRKDLVDYVDECNPVTIGRDVGLLIDEWNDKIGGMKYRRTNHSGYDKNFFNEYYPKHVDDFYSLFFYDNKNTCTVNGITNRKLIGYSIISKQQIEVSSLGISQQTIMPSYSYLIRKCLSNNMRNLTLYIDYCSFRSIREKSGNSDGFGIHWGASKGSLLRYKESKFPVLNKSNIVFFTLKSNELFI